MLDWVFHVLISKFARLSCQTVVIGSWNHVQVQRLVYLVYVDNDMHNLVVEVYL